MDRDACLLPGYLLVNELQKAYPDCPHWRLSSLFSDYVESFRACAQMVSIIGQNEMRPVVEHSGCPEHLVNPWKLDPLSLRFNLKGTVLELYATQNISSIPFFKTILKVKSSKHIPNALDEIISCYVINFSYIYCLNHRNTALFSRIIGKTNWSSKICHGTTLQ